MSTKILGFILICFCFVVPAADAMDSESPSAAENGAVLVKNFTFSPATLHIRNGSTVTWKNLDGEPHAIASDSGLFRSGALDEGDSFQFTFDKPGTYPFFCSVHPHMRGVIVVE